MAFTWKNLRLKNFTSGGWDGNNTTFWDPRHPLNAFIGAGSTGNRERIENDFQGYVNGAFKSNGPVFACIQARSMVFSEARFQWRKMTNGRPGDLFGSPELDLLENPWPSGTTGELLARMEQDASLSGNFFATVADDAGNLGNAATGEGRRIVRLRPDWVTILIGTKKDGIEGIHNADAKVLGYFYQPAGITDALGFPTLGTDQISGEVMLLPEEVCHYSPTPDPIARFRGMSWLTPIVREVQADSLATVHKKTFFENSAVPNMVVKFDKDTSEDTFDEFVEKFQSGHQGAWNAYKTLFLMGGADVTPLTHDFRQLEFSQTVGKGESRIAAAAGVPSSWVGFSEGMQGSSLNSGNYAASRRRFADGTIRPMWRMAASSLQTLIKNVPSGAHLWYDERDIAFLREDATDRAEIMRINLNAADAGIKSGFEPDAVIEAVRDNDISKLIGSHTGLVSVQMQPPVDPDNSLEETHGEAEIMQTLALVVQSFVSAGFTHESAVEAADTNDLTKLKKDIVPDPWSPTGQPLMTGGPGGGAPAPGGAKPPAKPAAAGTAPAKPKPKPAPGGSNAKP